MSAKQFLFRSSAGIDHSMITEDGKTRFVAEADVAPVLEHNKAAANHNDGYSASRDLRRVASIPYVVMIKWLNEEGFWALDADKDPDVAKKLAAKLNDPDWRYLRTADGHVGISDGKIR
jgi:hypothetical protein